MTRPVPDQFHVQLVAVDHECLFSVVLYAYGKVLKGADRSILHRAVLSLDYKPDSDEVNRLRRQQNRLRDVGAEQSLIDDLETRLALEHGGGRRASELAKMTLKEVRDAGIRWSVIGKRGAPIGISPEFNGLLDRLDPDASGTPDLPAALTGTESPADGQGDPVFGPGPWEDTRVYRSPASVLETYEALSFIDRPTLDAAIDAVVGTGPEAEETATWLEADFEALTSRYEVSAAKGLGIHYRYA
jgi:hypothetical protein